jgi:hypothetical protein
MRKALLFLICLLLTSCFDITERITHRNDNSGDYSLIIDFSKSWFKTKSAIWLEEVDGVSIPSEEEIKSKLAEFRQNTSKIPGVSKITTSYNFETYIFKIKFSYANLEALNAVLNSMDKNNKLTHFKSVNGNFERVASYPIPTNIIKNDDKKEDLQKANIIAIYSFDKEISTTNNSNVILSKSKKTAFLRNNVWNVLHNTTIMNNSITFTP